MEKGKEEIKLKRFHRCPESLRNKMRITLKDELLYHTDKWELYKPKYDYDWDSWYLEKIAEIKYCPFCGERLNSTEENNKDNNEDNNNSKDILNTEK